MADKPVALVSMPTMAAYVPSFQLALLQPTLERAGIEVDPLSLFVHFGRQTGWEINDVLATVFPCMAGEWIWVKAAFGDFADDAPYLDRYASSFEQICRAAGCTLEDIRRVRDHHAPAFVDWAVREIDWAAYGLVGFTVVFQQMVASLALAKAIKRAHPQLPIIFGGATFEDDIASEILRRNPEVDYVHCGDADETLPEVVRRVRGGQSMRALPGVMWRDGGSIAYAGRAPNLEDLNQTPVPDFDEYFHTRVETGYDDDHRDPVMLPIETARGCWYGMKHHCTFCGLNRAGMDYRRKHPDQVLDMLKVLSRRYGTRWFNAIDNILAPAYITRLFGRLAEAHSDLRIHYEIRPTLGRTQLGALRQGGLVSVQPGVESFSTNVLTLMKKFTTGIKNVELLKWTSYYGIDNLYNILYGFPGETADDYRQQAEVIRLITHLQPPYAMCQARPDRGSPMFERPDEHSIATLRPAACYRNIFPPEYDLERVSYFFEHEITEALPEDGYLECLKLVADWKRQWKRLPRPSLRYVKTWDSVTIHDQRNGAPRRYRFDDDRAALYELCADAKGMEEILPHFDTEPGWAEQALSEFVDRQLMIFLDDKYLSLALPDNPYH
ncbi:MAG: RiPP maturation radical SAM C-methyltransferase [Actinobacteria bacterium]|nr:RiPP maturation radical SAM C-methyltransferase [Actinomycetota bacterium]